MACVTKKRGRWCVDFYDQHGKRRLKILPKGSTKKEATVLLREIEEQVGKKTFMPAKQIPLFQEVSKDWIEYKKPNLRETTWEVYEGHVRNHFHDLDYLKINRIQTSTVEKFIRAKQDSGMHLLTLRKILVTLGQIFNYAVRHRYIDFNPLREAERPRSKGNEGESQSDRIKILKPDQIKIFLAKTELQEYRMLFTLAIFSGARQGELLGLKWGDIHWEDDQIHIQRTFNNGRFFEVKTKESNRKIDIGPRVMAALKKWKLACIKNELDLVFPNEAGKPIDHHNMVYRVFLPTLKAAVLPRIRFHDLRHTYASLLIEQGENPKYIQSQLGHSSPTVTMNVYAHLMKPTNPESAQRLENAIFR
jgi:integrase